MSDVILQQSLPADMVERRPLPGTRPVTGPWLVQDDAYAGQMARRAHLIAERPGDVLFLDPGAREAADELLALALAESGFPVTEGEATRPDGHRIRLQGHPMALLGRLFQQDFCILQKRGDEHVLTGAVLCFPASWSLAEKAGRGLVRIHAPVPDYDDGIAKRVQRLFDGVRPGRPIWRFNRLWYRSAELYQPRSEHNRRPEAGAVDEAYLRSERQTILRLPESDAVVFAIHTFVLDRARARAALETAPPATTDQAFGG